MVTIMKINEYAQKFKPQHRYPLLPRVVCADGFTISVQCGKGNYCSPREDHATHYSSFELGYPSDLDEVTNSLLKSYAEAENTVDTVFGYVPEEVVDQLLDAHGGIKWISHNGTLVEIRLAPLINNEHRLGLSFEM